MRLDRNEKGTNKYAVIKLRRMPGDPGRRADVEWALEMLRRNDMLVEGVPGTENEFFVIMLKDKYADVGLREYAAAARADGEAEYAKDVCELASRAGHDSPYCKKPD